jgi:ornithine carrier protein
MFTGAWDCLSYTVKTGGIRALYSVRNADTRSLSLMAEIAQGIMSPIAGSMMENAMLFLAYEQARIVITEQTGGRYTLGHVAVAGASAGVATTLVLTPVGACQQWCLT